MAKEAAPVATAKERDVRPPAVDAFFRRYLFCFVLGRLFPVTR